MASKKHDDIIMENFGSQAAAYLTSPTHAAGEDLERLAAILRGTKGGTLLDLGCGAGHVAYLAAPLFEKVVAYDMSVTMLTLVERTARERKLGSIEIRQGRAESLPFPDASFDVVASRYSAHHWHDAGRALREVTRVLKPGGLFALVDVVSPGHPVLDVFLQTVEMLRDASHVRDYAPSEWLNFLGEAGLRVTDMTNLRIRHDFAAWKKRTATPAPLVTAVRELEKYASREAVAYFGIEEDGSFSDDVMVLRAVKGVYLL